MDGGGYGIVYLIVYGGFAAFVLAVLIVAFLLIRKGFKKLGALVLLGLLLAGVIPALESRLETNKIAEAAQAASFAPDMIDFAGKRVVFAETASTICEADICGYALRHGGLSEVFSVAANNLSYHHPDLSWPFEAMEADALFYRVELTDPDTAQGGLSFPDPVAELRSVPEVDYTVLIDDSFLTLDYAEAFDLSEDMARTIRFAYSVYEGWPEPGQAPIARLLTAQYSVEPFFVWPVSTDHVYSPPLFEHRDKVRSWFCAAPTDSPYFAPDQCTPE